MSEELIAQHAVFIFFFFPKKNVLRRTRSTVTRPVGRLPPEACSPSPHPCFDYRATRGSGEQRAAGLVVVLPRRRYYSRPSCLSVCNTPNPTPTLSTQHTPTLPVLLGANYPNETVLVAVLVAVLVGACSNPTLPYSTLPYPTLPFPTRFIRRELPERDRTGRRLQGR